MKKNQKHRLLTVAAPIRAATVRESRMALRAAKVDESCIELFVELCVMLDAAWAVEAGTTLDQLKP